MIPYQTPPNMHKIYLLPIFLLLAFSCTAPRVVTQISPEAPEGLFVNGREYIALESEQIEVELGFDGIQDEYLVFDLLVLNSSADTLSLNPSDFYYLVLDSANDYSSPHTPWMAVHPDKVLTYYEESLEERKKEKGLNTFFGILQASVSILYNTSGFIATENPGYIADAVLHTAGTAGQYISQDKEISSRMEMISEEKEVVREEILRNCVVPPATASSGYVFFPRNERAAYYMFCFPINNQLFQYVYNQRQALVYD